MLPWVLRPLPEVMDELMPCPELEICFGAEPGRVDDDIWYKLPDEDTCFF
jgi:hypothetical protein